MAALPYMQLFVAEYLADTQHLTGAQHGAYLLLMMNYWTRGKALIDSDERLAVIARTDLPDWREKVRPALEEYFTITGGTWTHGRIERDLETVNAKCEQAKNNRAQRKQSRESTDVPTGVPTAVVPREEKRREETRVEEQKQKLASTADAVPASPAVESFPLTAGKTHIVTEADVASYQRAYPAVDVRQELRKALLWLDANPDKRSATVNGSKQRIVRWLARTQNDGGSRGASVQRPDATVGMVVKPEMSETEAVELRARIAAREAERRAA